MKSADLEKRDAMYRINGRLLAVWEDVVMFLLIRYVKSDASLLLARRYNRERKSIENGKYILGK